MQILLSAHAFCMRIAIRYSMRTSGQNAYIHEQPTKEFGVHIVAGST